MTSKKKIIEFLKVSQAEEVDGDYILDILEILDNKKDLHFWSKLFTNEDFNKYLSKNKNNENLKKMCSKMWCGYIVVCPWFYVSKSGYVYPAWEKINEIIEDIYKELGVKNE